MAHQLRERIDKWDYMELKSFCTTKEMIMRWRDSLQNGSKSLPAVHLTRN
jgi:hypothetical protein